VRRLVSAAGSYYIRQERPTKVSICSENSLTTKPTWSFVSLGNSKQISNTFGLPGVSQATREKKKNISCFVTSCINFNCQLYLQKETK